MARDHEQQYPGCRPDPCVCPLGAGLEAGGPWGLAGPGEARTGHSVRWRGPYGSRLSARARWGAGPGCRAAAGAGRIGGRNHVHGPVPTQEAGVWLLWGTACPDMAPTASLPRGVEAWPRGWLPGHLQPGLASPGIPRGAHPTLRGGSARLPSSCGETFQELLAVVGAVASRQACHTWSSPAAHRPWLPRCISAAFVGCAGS